MGRCRVPDCSGTTEYDENAQAVLCTTCGTVTTQDVLTHEWDGELAGSSLYFGPTTLKSLRRVGAGLAGQSSKEDRDRRNTTAMHQYILGLSTKLSCPGIAARSQTLFDQVRARGKYRWGKKAVLVAGACIAIVLRESRKGVMMSHLASLMDISPHALCRMFTQTCTVLNLHVPLFDPLTILPTLQSHLITLITSSTSPLPKPLKEMLQALPLAPILHLASSLAALLNDLDEFSSPGPSACPTACALFIVALEGQAASSLPSYTILAQELGAKMGARKDLVTRRYRDILTVLEEWMMDIPWLSKADHPDNKLGKRRRKTSQRDLIAMGIRDIIQFREDIQMARECRVSESPISLSLEVDEVSDGSGSSTHDSTSQLGQKRKCEEEPQSRQSSRSLRLIRTHGKRKPLSQIDLASLSLLSPSHPLAPDHQRVSSQPTKESLQFDTLQNHIMTSSTFPIEIPLTRLQWLTIERGGESEIKDDELFDEGELEGILREGDEVAKLRGMFGWEEPDASIEGQTLTSSPSSQILDWDLTEMAVWENIGNDEDIDRYPEEQILGEWREASPFSGTGAVESNNFDIHSEW
ncbi:hypothetical protein K439DRAFT_1616226 [Ramaria rubella]|nr:hypothetical protein K439DRAFT_1616226 [Ramaria rubella]